MPPKFKFTKQQIIDTALEIVKKEGISALTARALAQKLGSSAKPIFTMFENMEEVQTEVIKAAYGVYQAYIEKGMTLGEYPPYKASGMAYIQFAKEQKELFKLLFMRDRSGENIVEDRESVRPILNIIMQNLGIGEDEAYLLHMELWLYVHGIATMAATSYLDWDIEFISRALTDAYQGLKYRFTEAN